MLMSLGTMFIHYMPILMSSRKPLGLALSRAAETPLIISADRIRLDGWLLSNIARANKSKSVLKAQIGILTLTSIK